MEGTKVELPFCCVWLCDTGLWGVSSWKLYSKEFTYQVLLAQTLLIPKEGLTSGEQALDQFLANNLWSFRISCFIRCFYIPEFWDIFYQFDLIAHANNDSWWMPEVLGHPVLVLLLACGEGARHWIPKVRQAGSLYLCGWPQIKTLDTNARCELLWLATFHTCWNIIARRIDRFLGNFTGKGHLELYS